MIINTVQVSQVQITPDYARQLLANNTEHQRAVSKNTVDRYARAMLAGKWQMTGEAIQISAAGKLLNGQHRLHAIIKSNCTITILVVSGLEDSAFSSIDQVRPRSLADLLTIEGAKNATGTVAVATVLLQLEAKVRSIPRPELYDIKRILNLYPLEAVSYPRRIEPGLYSGGAPVLAGLVMAQKHYQVSIDELVSQVVSGYCKKGDPAYALRGAVASNQSGMSIVGRFVLACKAVRAVEAIAKREKLYLMRDDVVSVLDRMPAA